MMRKRAKRLPADARKKQILENAVAMSRKLGYKFITRTKIANKIGVTSSNLVHHFARMGALRTAVLKYAIEHEILDILAQGLVNKESIILKMDSQLRDKVITYLTNL